MKVMNRTSAQLTGLSGCALSNFGCFKNGFRLPQGRERGYAKGFLSMENNQFREAALKFLARFLFGLNASNCDLEESLP